MAVLGWNTHQIPPDGPRLQILKADGAEYLEEPGHGMDLLLVDAFDKAGFAPGLANGASFEAAQAMHVFDDQVSPGQ